MLEGIGALLAVLLLLLLCSGEERKPPRFSIEETQYSGFYEVRDTHTGETKFIGTEEQCEKWITDNDN